MEGGGGIPREWGWGSGVVGKRDTGLTLHCHRQNDSALRWALMRTVLMLSLTVRGKITRQCP